MRVRTTERPHGTRARYVFGPFGSDRASGCRCDACLSARGRYARDRERNRTRVKWGLEEPWPGTHVPAGRARRHLEWLRSESVGLRAVKEQSGVSRSALQRIMSGGSLHVTRRTEDKILAVGRSVVRPGAYVDGEETWARIADLLAAGWTRTAIAQKVTGPQAKALQLHDRVSAKNARTVADLHLRVFPELNGTPFARRQSQRSRSSEPISGHQHGSPSAYNDGCGCEACRVGAAQRRAAARTSASARAISR